MRSWSPGSRDTLASCPATPRSSRRSGPARSRTASDATSTPWPCRVASRRSGTIRSSFSPTRPSGLMRSTARAPSRPGSGQSAACPDEAPRKRSTTRGRRRRSPARWSASRPPPRLTSRLPRGEGTPPPRLSSVAVRRSITPRRRDPGPLASRLRLTGRDANDPDRRRRGQHRRARAGDPRGRADPDHRGARRRDGARPRRGPPARTGAPGREPARHERPGGLRSAPARRALRRGEDRDAHGGSAGRRRQARAGRRRGSLSDEALLTARIARPDRDTPAVRHRMAARLVSVAFPAGDDLTAAYRRLSAAYQQALRYAEDVKRLYQQVQRAIYQSLLGLANALEAKDAYTRGHSERVGAASRSVAAALGLPPHEVE